jgi:hypothetical protein
MFLNISHPDRAPAARITCAGTMVMLAQAPLRVGRPAGVIAPIRTGEDVTITGHDQQLIIPGFLFAAAPEQFIQSADLLFHDIAKFGHFRFA